MSIPILIVVLVALAAGVGALVWYLKPGQGP